MKFAKQNPYRIDIHHHAIPPEVVESFNQIGISNMGGVPFSQFKMERTLAFMDKALIKTAIVSLSEVGNAFLKEENAITIARQANQYYANLRADYPKRFGAFATLPLPHLQASLDEISYTLNTLNFEGVMMFSNANGVYLGDPSLDKIMKELDKRKAVVYVHPSAPENKQHESLKFPRFLLDFVFDTTQAITNMLFNKTAKKYPKIKFIFAHMGGTAPYLSERLALGLLERRRHSKLPVEKISTGISQIISPETIVEFTTHIKKTLSSFYYDTALSSMPATISAVQKLAGVEHILYGSDYEYAPELVEKLSTQLLMENNDLNEDDRKLIEYENALRLFPHLNK